MTNHNLSIDDYFNHLAEEHRPRLRFDGRTENDWAAWREELLPAAVGSLGSMPPSVTPDPQVVAEWREGGLVKQRVLFTVERGLSAAAYYSGSRTCPFRCPPSSAATAMGRSARKR